MIEHLSDELLSARLDGALDAGEAARVAEHLSGCADCARRVDLLGATARAVSGLPDEPLPAALDLSFLAPATATDPLVLPANRRWRPPAWAAPVLAAAALLLVAVSVAPGLLARRVPATDSSTASGAQFNQGSDRSGVVPATPGALAPGALAPGAAQNADGSLSHDSIVQGPHATRGFPGSGGVVLDLSGSQQTTHAGQPVGLSLTVRAGSTTVQVQRTSITVHRGTATEQVASGGGQTIAPGQSSSLSGTWDAGKLGSAPEAPGDYPVDGDVVLADGTTLEVSFTIQVS